MNNTKIEVNLFDHFSIINGAAKRLRIEYY